MAASPSAALPLADLPWPALRQLVSSLETRSLWAASRASVRVADILRINHRTLLANRKMTFSFDESKTEIVLWTEADCEAEHLHIPIKVVKEELKEDAQLFLDEETHNYRGFYILWGIHSMLSLTSSIPSHKDRFIFRKISLSQGVRRDLRSGDSCESLELTGIHFENEEIIPGLLQVLKPRRLAVREPSAASLQWMLDHRFFNDVAGIRELEIDLRGRGEAFSPLVLMITKCDSLSIELDLNQPQLFRRFLVSKRFSVCTEWISVEDTIYWSPIREGLVQGRTIKPFYEWCDRVQLLFGRLGRLAALLGLSTGENVLSSIVVALHNREPVGAVWVQVLWNMKELQARCCFTWPFEDASSNKYEASRQTPYVKFLGDRFIQHSFALALLDNDSRLIEADLWLQNRYGKKHRIYKYAEKTVPPVVLGAMVGRVVVEEILWTAVGLVGTSVRGLYTLFEALHAIAN